MKKYIFYLFFGLIFLGNVCESITNPEVAMDFKLMNQFMQYDRVVVAQKELMIEEQKLMETLRYFLYNKAISDFSSQGGTTITIIPPTPGPTVTPKADSRSNIEEPPVQSVPYQYWSTNSFKFRNNRPF